MRVGEEPPPLLTEEERRQREHRGEPKGPSTAKRTAKERFRLLNSFIDFGMAKLSRVEALTWLTIYRDTRDGVAKVSYEAIGRRVGCSRRSVYEAVRRLKQLGLVQVTCQGGFQKGPSVFRVCSPNAARL